MKFGFRSFLEDDEVVLNVFRRPLLFIMKAVILRLIFWGTIVFVIWFLYPRYEFDDRMTFDINYIWQIVAFVGWCHTVQPVFFWYVNALVMTNESLVIIQWPRFFVRRSSRIDFHNLDEITVERDGIRSFIFNYGDILLSKVNGGDIHTVDNISRPRRTTGIIEDYRERHLDEKNFTEESALKGLLGSMVQRHVKGTGQPTRSRADMGNPADYRPNITRQDPNGSHIERSSPAPKTPYKKKHFDDMPDIEIEKELDDTGGIDVDLEDES